MSTETTTPGKRELEDAIAHLGSRDPETMRRACEEMDRMREETRRRVGTINVAVDLVREFRDR